MGMRAHVQTKHVIEFGGGEYFSWRQQEIYGWLCENGVSVYTTNDQGEYAEDWEIDKSSLQSIPEDAYKDIENSGGDVIVDADELREFVDELREAPTGEYAYVSWF